MRRLAAVVLAVYGVVTAHAWCTKDDAETVVRQWSQAFGIGGNGNREAAIQGGSGFFIQYVRPRHTRRDTDLSIESSVA